MIELKQPKINLRDCPTIKCEKCEGIYFNEVIYLKRVPALMTGSQEDTTVPFPIYKCESCGHVNKGFNPFDENEKTLIND
jgi:predicted nucleic acid-binding Zn ribbon protein